MPKAFLTCIDTPGSKKFTKDLGNGRYVVGCKKPGSDKAVWGEVKTKGEEKKK